MSDGEPTMRILKLCILVSLLACSGEKTRDPDQVTQWDRTVSPLQTSAARVAFKRALTRVGPLRCQSKQGTRITICYA